MDKNPSLEVLSTLSRPCSVILTDCMKDPTLQKYFKPEATSPQPIKLTLKRFSSPQETRVISSPTPKSPLRFTLKKLGSPTFKHRKNDLFEKSKKMARQFIKIKWTPKKKVTTHKQWLNDLSRSIPNNNKNFGVDFSAMPSQFAVGMGNASPQSRANLDNGSTAGQPTGPQSKTMRPLTLPGVKNLAPTGSNSPKKKTLPSVSSPPPATKTVSASNSGASTSQSKTHKGLQKTLTQDNQSTEEKDKESDSLTSRDKDNKHTPKKPSKKTDQRQKFFTYRCHKCLACFCNKETAAAHINGPVHAGECDNNFCCCPYCYFPIERRTLLKLHMHKCHFEQIEQGLITFDGITVGVDYSNLVKQDVLDNLQGNEIFACQWCDYDFENFHRLHYHMFTMHKPLIALFCALCKQKIPWENICNHYLQHNTVPNVRSYVSFQFADDDIASSFFIISKNEDAEDRVSDATMSASEDVVYKCRLCSYEHDNLNRIKSHMNVHLEASPATCNICSERLRNTSDVYFHHLQHNNTVKSIDEILKAQFYTCHERGAQQSTNTVSHSLPVPTATSMAQTTILRPAQPPRELAQQPRVQCVLTRPSADSDLAFLHIPDVQDPVVLKSIQPNTDMSNINLPLLVSLNRNQSTSVGTNGANPIGPNTNQSNPIGPNVYQSSAVQPNPYQLNPVLPNVNQFNPVGPNTYQWNPVRPNPNQLNPVATNTSQSNPVGPNANHSKIVGPKANQPYPVGPNGNQSNPAGPSANQSNTVGPNLNKSSPIEPNAKQLNPVVPNAYQLDPVGPNGNRPCPPVGLNASQLNQVGPNANQLNPVGPFPNQSNPVGSNANQLNPVQSNADEPYPIEPNGNQLNTVGPYPNQSNPVGPYPNQSNPVGPNQWNPVGLNADKPYPIGPKGNQPYPVGPISCQSYPDAAGLVSVHVSASVPQPVNNDVTFCINNQHCKQCQSLCTETQSPTVLDKEFSPELADEYTVLTDQPSITGKWCKCRQCSFKTQYYMVIERHVLYHKPVNVDMKYKCNFPGCVFGSSFKELFDHHKLDHGLGGLAS